MLAKLQFFKLVIVVETTLDESADSFESQS